MNHPQSRLIGRAFSALLAAGWLAAAPAQTTVEITPTRDNTLYESGSGSLSNGAGTALFVGRTAQGDLRRAVIAFDDLSQIPADAQITAVELTLRMNRTTSGARTIGVHRLQQDWGEAGSFAGGQQGGGGTAQTGDATWIHRFFSDQRWNSPGGDFDAAAVSETSVAGVGSYTFPSSPGFIALVQSWIDDPGSNFGVILVADESGAASTAKRFSSREGTPPPVLRVTYSEGAPQQFAINQGIAGGWLNQDTAGQGFLIDVEPESSFIFVAWFTYEAGGVGTKVGAPEHRWLTAQGNYSGNTADIPIFVTSGGVFDASDMTTTETAGSMILSFENCNQGLIVFELDDGPSGEIPITRLLPDAQMLCETLQESGS